jgi:CDP-glucose 4,6-dehydratase
MKYFITGGSGLIGQFLLPKLLEAGHEVFNFDMAEGRDILDIYQVRGALSQETPDAVIHLAAQSGVEEARSWPSQALSLNVTGTINVLDSCRQYGVQDVIVASSNHVYGAQPKTPFTEDMALNQRDLYSASKICADVITQAYAHNYGLNAVAVRLTNTYGPGDMHEDHIIPGTIQSLLCGERPQIRSRGRTKKSYLYGEDCADAFITIAQNCERLKGQAVNIPGSKPVSALKLVQILTELSDTDLEPEILGEDTDQNDEYLDGSKMAALGWEPKYDLAAGLWKTYAWFAERARQEVAV